MEEEDLRERGGRGGGDTEEIQQTGRGEVVDGLEPKQ